jgi:membrane-associated sensor protein
MVAVDAQDNADYRQISLACLPPTARQTRSALAGAALLLLGLAVLAPFAHHPVPLVDGFIPALDAIIFVTDLITACLLLAHVSVTRSRALLALACGYLFSATIVVAHGLSSPGAISPTGNFGGIPWANFKIYLFWHLGLPTAMFAYVWLRDKDSAKASALTPIGPLAACSVAGVLFLVGCIVWFSATDTFLHGRSLAAALIIFTMLVCAAALVVLWVFRRSALDQWLMVVTLALIVELAITALFGGLLSLGFYTGRVFSLVTSTVVLTVQRTLAA